MNVAYYNELNFLAGCFCFLCNWTMIMIEKLTVNLHMSPVKHRFVISFLNTFLYIINKHQKDGYYAVCWNFTLHAKS